MSKHRINPRSDANQQDIVKTLRSIPGVTVATGHDDILIGFRGRTYWIEWKDKRVVRKDGTLKAGALKPSQVKLKEEWSGHYAVCWTLEQILSEIGVTVR